MPAASIACSSSSMVGRDCTGRPSRRLRVHNTAQCRSPVFAAHPAGSKSTSCGYRWTWASMITRRFCPTRAHRTSSLIAAIGRHVVHLELEADFPSPRRIQSSGTGLSFMLERLFKLHQHQTTVSREVQAGLTTFAAMAYILAVNPE